MTKGTAPILAVENLRISYFVRAGEINVIPDLSFTLKRNEALGLVGESGCGKSTVALAMMRYLGRAGRVTGGRVLLEGRDLAAASEAELRALRGNRVAMVYQDPMSSLNPVMTVGRQLMEVPLLHAGVSEADARGRALAMLAEVNLPDAAAVMERYPHQLSGGQQQRIVIAMALIAEPALLILDEPTTGLDVTVEAAVLELVAALRRRHETAILFISHNLGTVARVCDRVGVMYAGELVEVGPVRTMFRAPRHPYTRGLLDCLPTLGRDKSAARLATIPGQVSTLLVRPQGCSFAQRCGYTDPPRCTSHPIPLFEADAAPGHGVRCVRLDELPPWQRATGVGVVAEGHNDADTLIDVEGLRVHYGHSAGWFGRSRPVRAVDGVELAVRRARTLAIVGESGSGKSTLAKAITGLERATGGRIRFHGMDIAGLSVEQRPVALKRRVQMVFQNPDSTLNPSHSVGYSIGRAVRRLRGYGRRDTREAVAKLLDAVRLPRALADRKPHQLSGGQKQRIAIARALAGDPEVMVADEPVSALDVSVQAAIVNLLSDLQTGRDQTLIFISHDLAVVRYLADEVAVMYLGKIVEAGTAAEVFAPPFHPYTEALLSAVAEPDPDANRAPIVLEGRMPSATETIAGCVFASRCPRYLGRLCDDQPPPERRSATGHRILCHIPLPDLAATAMRVTAQTVSE